MSSEPAVLTLVGTGTLVPDADHGSAAFHLRAAGASVLLDCGPGTLHGLPRAGVDWAGISHLLVTHFHNDHVADLPGFLLALDLGVPGGRFDALRLVGPVGLEALLDRYASAIGDRILRSPFPVTFSELEPGAGLENDDFSVSVAATGHTERSLAYRLEGDWGSVAYTGDLGPDADLADFLSGVDVLVAGCAHPDPPPNRDHLSPSTLGALARAAAPELLVVTHVYPPGDPADVARRVEAGSGVPTVPGRDGARVVLRDDGPAVDLPVGRL